MLARVALSPTALSASMLAKVDGVAVCAGGAASPALGSASGAGDSSPLAPTSLTVHKNKTSQLRRSLHNHCHSCVHCLLLKVTRICAQLDFVHPVTILYNMTAFAHTAQVITLITPGSSSWLLTSYNSSAGTRRSLSSFVHSNSTASRFG